ncbi:MAG: glycosyltransferase family 39 protein [Flavobacteriaceae bacterium]
MHLKLPRLFLYLLGAIFVLNILQAYFTELIFDEAYYWHYAQNMAWGYFDHPPMVALLIKISSFFFKEELGVRFMSCILSVGTLLMLWLLIDNDKKKNYIIHFFVLTFSMTLLNAYGFFTLPDTPFLFFTAAFLLVYKKFIDSPSILLALIMGVLMASLMYSKYNAVLVIIFVLLSNLKLLANKYAWLSVIVALVCYIPHFVWLYQNDLVSITYHLIERPNNPYDFEKYTLGYFMNLLALFGFMFPWIYKTLFQTKSSDQFTKALLYLTYGIMIFFFISSFHRSTQAQWLIVISIPLAVLVFNEMFKNENTRKWIYRMGILNLVILLYLRIGLVYAPLFPIHYESHGNKEWVEDIRSQVGDIPVVFENSYRNASMYAFYSGNPAFSLNNLHYRRNQYSLDSSESRIQHQKVLYASSYMKEWDFTFSKDGDKGFYGKYIEDFESFRKLECFIEETPLLNYLDKGGLLKVYNPYSVDIVLKKLKFGVVYLDDFKDAEEVQPITTTLLDQNILTLKSNDTTYFTFKLPKPKTENIGFFRIGISENSLLYGLNGPIIKLN